MSRAGLTQLICVVLLVAFIAFSLSGEKDVTVKSAAEISEEITAVIDTENLISFDGIRLKDEFGFDGDSFESWVFIGSEDIMDVREILVIKPSEDADTEEIISAIEKRATEKYNTYKDYDPVASSILEARLIRESDGVIFYCAHEQAREGAEAFLKSVKE